jgi:Uma2 family endonuclease
LERRQLDIDAEVPDEPVHRLTVEQYDEMARAGILTSDDRVELLEGWLIEKMTKNPPHRIATRKTRERLEALPIAGWYVDSQEPIVTAESEPEPDVVIVRGRTEDYADKHPGAANVALVVEVADVTLARDRVRKARIYARAGIPTYWILNLTDRKLEVYSRPTGESPAPRYQDARTLGPDESVAVVLEDIEIGRVVVRDLLP